MMGHKRAGDSAQSGHEVDCVTGWRRVLTSFGRAGVTSWIKRAMRRRSRRGAREEIRNA